MERKKQALTRRHLFETEYICMTFTWEFRGRRSIRMPDYDYSVPGWYFITICVKNRQCVFGDVVDGKMVLSRFGYIAKQSLKDVPKHYKHVRLDSYIVMPNHVHVIIVIRRVGAGFKPAPTGLHPTHITDGAGLKPAPTGKRQGLSETIRAFKTFSAQKINMLRQSSGDPFWQRNFHERIIWTDEGLASTRDYIRLNPLRWHVDPENPNRPE